MADSRQAGAQSLVLSDAAGRLRAVAGLLGRALLFLTTSVAALAVLFIIFFIARDALPFFRIRGVAEFFTSTAWYPSGHPAQFGAAAIFLGSALVTMGALVVAVPLGIAAAVCLSDVLPFHVRQIVKPVIEMLAAIPSVAYGFFALVVFAPLLQERGGPVLAAAWWLVATPILFLTVLVAGDMVSGAVAREGVRKIVRFAVTILLGALSVMLLLHVGHTLSALSIPSGANALNVSLILGVMALPTVVSVSEDALQAVGRELREGCYALGATRAETLVQTIIPAAGSGILAAALLGVMRALGETMVVWMASGNAAQIPTPWFNLLSPVRTLTATIAGDMGEADHVTGSARYHVLFAMGLSLLLFCFVCNLASEWVVSRQRRRLGGG